MTPNLVQRNLTADQPNQVWTGEITYIVTDEGWLYLSVVLDLFCRQVVGWRMQANMQSSLATDALRMAWFIRAPDAIWALCQGLELTWSGKLTRP